MATMTHAHTETRRSTWIPWLFVAAFLVVAAANGVLILVATSTFNGLTTENAFVEGLAFNKTLDDAAHQERLGWIVTPSFRGDGPRHGIFEVSLRAPDGTILTGASATLALVRPTQEGFDFDVPLADRGQGRHGADLEFPLSGIWDVRVTVTRDGDTIRQTRRIVVP
jgi:nitrogen fixation protein FixH